MKPIVKRILAVVVILLAAGGAGVYLLMPAAVPMTLVQPTTARLTFTEPGTVNSDTNFLVYPLVQGEVVSVPVNEGDRVAAGDVLCVIDDQPLRHQYTQTQQTIRSYTAQMKTAAAQSASGSRAVEERLRLQDLLIQQQELETERMGVELEKLEFLFGEGQISRAELDTAKDAAEQQKLALEAARQERAVIQAGDSQESMAEYYGALIRLEEENLARISQQLEHCTVKSPVEGVIVTLPVQGINLAGGSPVAEIARTEELVIHTHVSTQDVDSVKLGDQVELVLKRRDGDLTCAGTVTKIHPRAEVMYSALGLEERRVEVEIAPDLAALGGTTLGAGYDVQVEFLLYSRENALVVPKTALFQVEGQDTVWAAVDGKLRALPVAAGMELRTQTVVLSGLEPGTYVVTDANDESLKEGMGVKPA